MKRVVPPETLPDADQDGQVLLFVVVIIAEIKAPAVLLVASGFGREGFEGGKGVIRILGIRFGFRLGLGFR